LNLTEEEMDGMAWAEMLVNKDQRPMIQAFWDRQKIRLREGKLVPAFRRGPDGRDTTPSAYLLHPVKD
jgi:hypothetical protein